MFCLFLNIKHPFPKCALWSASLRRHFIRATGKMCIQIPLGRAPGYINPVGLFPGAELPRNAEIRAAEPFRFQYSPLSRALGVFLSIN